MIWCEERFRYKYSFQSVTERNSNYILLILLKVKFIRYLQNINSTNNDKFAIHGEILHQYQRLLLVEFNRQWEFYNNLYECFVKFYLTTNVENAELSRTVWCSVTCWSDRVKTFTTAWSNSAENEKVIVWSRV